MAGLTGWKILVGVLCPIPLIISLLLSLPLPRNARRGVLLAAHRVLSFPTIGGARLASFALFTSGVPLLDASVRLSRAASAAAAAPLGDADASRPEVALARHAAKWRLERNWWIACMTFVSWLIVRAMRAQVARAVSLEERLEALADERAALLAAGKRGGGGGGRGGGEEEEEEQEDGNEEGDEAPEAPAGDPDREPAVRRRAGRQLA